MKYILYTAMAAVAMITACCNSDGDGEPTPARLQLTIAGVSFDSLTRADGTRFDAGDRIGLLVRHNNNIIYENVPAEYDGQNWRIESPIYYTEQLRQDMFVTAYYPYSDSFDPEEHLAYIDHRDIMTSQAATPSSVGSVFLQFKRRMARINIEVRLDTETSEEVIASGFILRTEDGAETMRYVRGLNIAGTTSWTPELVTWPTDGITSGPGDWMTLSTEYNTRTFYMPPLNVGERPNEDWVKVNLEMSINERPITVTTLTPNWHEGCRYNYRVTVHPSETRAGTQYKAKIEEI